MKHLFFSIKKISTFIFLCLFGFVVYAQTATPQSPAKTHDTQSNLDELKQANNPLARIKTFNVHDYYVASLYGDQGATLNQLWLRYAQPMGNFILRASMPFITMAPPDEKPITGLSDLNAFLIYKFKMKSKGVELGVGPAITFNTGTNGLGSGKWQAGLSAIAFFKSNPVVQVGTLLTWQMSFAGQKNRTDVNMLTPQIFFLWQVGGGTYLRSTGIWTFDLESGNYNVPIGLGIGRVMKVNKLVFNIFAEPQYSVFAYGAGQPKFQVFVGFNTQFY